jgi:hypothetical protein
MESGPSVRDVFAGVGISDFTSPLAAADVDDSVEDDADVVRLAAVVVAADELAETVCVTVAVVPELPPHAVAARPMAKTAPAKTYLLLVMFPTHVVMCQPRRPAPRQP